MGTQSTESSHYRRENVSICKVCDAYLNQGDVLRHMTDKHCDSYFYKCHLCRDYSGSISSSLFQHQKDKHDVSYYQVACPICMNFFSSQEKEVITHLVNVHSRIENLFVCNYCSLRSKFVLDAHFKETHSHYVCVFQNCQAVSQNSMDLFKHYMSYHFPKLTLLYSCSECDALFPKKNSLYQHKRDRYGIIEEEDDDEEEETFIEFSCPMCSFTTCDKILYKTHSINNHPNNFYNCTFQNCNYQTKLFWSITQHTIDKHMSETSFGYDCYACEEEISFNQVYSLIQHLRDKHSIVGYCSQCNTYEEDLSDHILDTPDHSYDVFSCRICDEEYDEKYELLDHLSANHVSIAPLLRSLCFGD